MPLVNALLVRYAAGFHETTDAGSIAVYGRREAFLSLPGAQTSVEAQRAAAAFFDQWATPAVAVVAGIEPIGVDDVPFVDFEVGELVTVPDEAGGSAASRVRAVSVEEDEDGDLAYVLELGSLRQEGEIRLARWLQRMADGTVGGVSLAASPQPGPSALPTSEAGGRIIVDRPPLPPYSLGGAVALKTSGPWVSAIDYRLGEVVAVLGTAGTSSTIVEVRKNGVGIGTITLPAASTGPVSLALSAAFVADTDRLSVAVTTAGAGAVGLVVIPRAV